MSTLSASIFYDPVFWFIIDQIYAFRFLFTHLLLDIEVAEYNPERNFSNSFKWKPVLYI